MLVSLSFLSSYLLHPLYSLYLHANFKIQQLFIRTTLCGDILDCVNDPSAGSPTETLLRLLLPLSDKVYLTSHNQVEPGHSPEGSPDHSKSVGATGGVYKGQGRNQHKLMTYAY